MSGQINITTAGNTLAPALAVLKRLGYKVSCVAASEKSGELLFQAEKSGIRLTAGDILSLLGLVKLVEERGKDWQPLEHEIAELLTLLDTTVQ